MPPLPVPGRYNIADGDIYYNNSVWIEQLISSYIDKQHKRNKDLPVWPGQAMWLKWRTHPLLPYI